MSTGALYAGAAKERITPRDDMLPFKTNFGLLNRVYEDVWVRAIVLGNDEEKVLLLGFDCSFPPEPDKLCERLSAKYGIDKKAMVFSGTTNHQAPVVGNDATIYDFRRIFHNDGLPGEPEMIRWYHDQADLAVGRAVAAMRPARIGFAVGQSGIAVNRERVTPCGTIYMPDFSDDSDRELAVAHIVDEQGKTIAVYMSYGFCACCTTGFDGERYHHMIDGVSGDVPGRVESYVETMMGKDSVALWSVGATGDQGAIVWGSINICEPVGEGKFRIRSTELSAEDAYKLRDYYASTQCLDVRDAIGSISEYRPDLEIRYDELIREAQGVECYHMNGVGVPVPTDPSLLPERPEHTPVAIRARLLTCNNAAFAAVNCNIYSRLGKQIKSVLPQEYVFLSTLSFGNNGYFPDERGYEKKGHGFTSTFFKDVSEARRLLVDEFRQLDERMRQ